MNIVAVESSIEQDNITPNIENKKKQVEALEKMMALEVRASEEVRALKEVMELSIQAYNLLYKNGALRKEADITENEKKELELTIDSLRKKARPNSKLQKTVSFDTSGLKEIAEPLCDNVMLCVLLDYQQIIDPLFSRNMLQPAQQFEKLLPQLLDNIQKADMKQVEKNIYNRDNKTKTKKAKDAVLQQLEFEKQQQLALQELTEQFAQSTKKSEELTQQFKQLQQQQQQQQQLISNFFSQFKQFTQ